MKNGKKVPNCVPIKQSKMSKEQIAEAKIKELKQLFSNQKIELGMIDDVNKRLDIFERKNKETKKIFDNVLKLKSKFKVEFKELQKEDQYLQKKYDEIFKKANELGADKIATEAFTNKALSTKYFGQGWDLDILRFFQS